MCNITELPEWQTLVKHHAEIKDHPMRDWFSHQKNRFDDFSITVDALLLDYSRHRITPKTRELLIDLAYAIELDKKINSLFAGDPINTSENRPALHTALRQQSNQPLLVNHKDIRPLINKSQQALFEFAEKVHHKRWLGKTGKPIEHIVTIGVGGSSIGPMMSTYALKDFAVSTLQFHFISSIDQTHLQDVLKQINPETTLFIVSSKSFTTTETLTNAKITWDWLQQQLGKENLSQHFVAITAYPEKAIRFGIPENQIFLLWDWVGGRYSIWSSIGLPLLLMIGTKHFKAFLEGAACIDEHFQKAPFEKNMPVILALLSIWYINFFHASMHAIAPYSHRLRHLIFYLQQAEMESNGKSITRDGKPITYPTSPILFGLEGSDGQHSYHQLLHQGQHLVPIDFMLVGNPNDPHHDLLIASVLSQAEALMQGKTLEESYQQLLNQGYSEEEAKILAHHQIAPGNRPSSILFLKELTPKSLGELIALYEHKIFVEGAIWGINSFDQWGVELGKQLLPTILEQIRNSSDIHQTPISKFIHTLKKWKALIE